MNKTSKLFDAVAEDNNYTFTENGRLANKSTLSHCLDFFGQAASCRNDLDKAKHLFRLAFLENQEIAVRTAFYMRDIRGKGIGMGERAIFRACMCELAELNPAIAISVLPFIPFFGRWDDLFVPARKQDASIYGIDTNVDKAIHALIANQLEQDLNNIAKQNIKEVSLLGKWLPSCNTSSKQTRQLAHKIRNGIMPGKPEAAYRRVCSILRRAINILETHISEKDYTFDYSKIPGKAALKYAKAFRRHDNDRYTAYHEALRAALANGNKTTKFNAGSLYPYEILERVDNEHLKWYTGKDSLSSIEVDNMWKSLPDYFSPEAKNFNWLVVGDTSASMLSPQGRPMTVACSLCMYMAAHNNGVFKDKFILFSNRPRFVKLDSSWPVEKQVNTYMNYGFESNNTNIDAVFDVILSTAVRHHLPESEMPRAIIIVSDMQFDTTINNYRHIDTVKREYAKAGYKMPKIVYWNVAQECKGNVPVTVKDDNCVLVNGCKPGMFEMVLAGANPEQFMLNVVNNERYSVISNAFKS